MAVLPRRTTRLPFNRTAVAAIAVFALACAVLATLGRDGGDASRLAGADAKAAALADRDVRAALAGGFTRVRTMPLDERTVRVSFFDGPRAVVEAAVGPDGRVGAVIEHDGTGARMGSGVGQRLPVLGGLALLFLLATLRVPLARRANADAAALAAFAIPIALVNARYLEWGVAAGAVLVLYLACRCVSVATARPEPATPGTPVFDLLSRRARGLLVAGAVAGLVVLSVPGGLVSDVGFASLAGATQILDGSLPYGNLATDGLVHGDTYPLFAYLMYVPAALVAPVRDGFDSLDGALVVATAFALGAAVALARAAGARAAVAFLAFPPLMVAASSGSNDVAAAAFVSFGLASAARPRASTAALTIAGWVKLGPLALLPIWVGRDRRGFAAAAAVTAVGAAILLALGGPGAFEAMARALSFQSQRGSTMSVWALVNAPAAQVAFQAAVVTAIALATVRVWRDPRLADDPARIAGLCAAALLGVQLAANHWSVTYLAWAFPLVAVALLAPARPSRPRARAWSRPVARP